MSDTYDEDDDDRPKHPTWDSDEKYLRRKGGVTIWALTALYRQYPDPMPVGAHEKGGELRINLRTAKTLKDGLLIDITHDRKVKLTERGLEMARVADSVAPPDNRPR